MRYDTTYTVQISTNRGVSIVKGLDTMAYNLTKQIALFVLLLQLCKPAKNYNLGGRTRHSRINRHIFSIPPKSSVTKYSNNFIMQNIGRTDLTVSYGKRDETWKPGTMQHFKNLVGIIYKIENKDEKTRAIVYINNYNKLGFFKRDKNIKTLEESFTLGVNIINDIDKGLPSLINSFWPKKRRDVWQKLELNFEILDHTKIYKIVHEDLDQIGKNIVNLVTSSSGNDYMELAKSMVDLEKKFIIKKSRESKGNNFIKTNLYTLPFYTNVVTMKIHFYAIGLAKANIFHLDDSQIKILQQYSDNTLFGADGAIKYVNDMNKDAIDFLYNTVYPAELYDVMMIARTHIAVHGLEMIPIWERTNSDPNSKKNPYIDVILYSTFYGTATPNLFQQATPEKIPQPLTPPLKNDKKRAKLSSIKFYSNFVKGFVEGLELKFEERAPLLMGRKTYNETMIDFEGETITSLSLMDLWHRQTLEFILFNGRIIRIEFPGNTPHHLLYTYKIFHLTDHHIASLYMDISNRIDNIAMSFRRNS